MFNELTRNENTLDITKLKEIQLSYLALVLQCQLNLKYLNNKTISNYYILITKKMTLTLLCRTFESME